MTRKRAQELRKLIELAVISLEDNKALTGIELFPKWEPNISYQTGERIRWDNKLYRIVQAHTSQGGWEPDITPALFTEVALPGEIPVWKQPTGAQDVYMKGDKVKYPDVDGNTYISIVDNNSWAPDVYGWELA